MSEEIYYREEALIYLLENKGNCAFRSCKKCFFANEYKRCSITEPYRNEQEVINRIHDKNIKSCWIGIKYEYAQLNYNRIYIRKEMQKTSIEPLEKEIEEMAKALAKEYYEGEIEGSLQSNDQIMVIQSTQNDLKEEAERNWKNWKEKAEKALKAIKKTKYTYTFKTPKKSSKYEMINKK